MKEEHYIKVHINSPDDLPEEEGYYFIGIDTGDIDEKGVFGDIEKYDPNNEDDRLSWLNSVKWYLKPEEPAKGLTDERTSKLEKDLKDAEAMFEKMELTAFNLDKRIKKLEELVSAHKNLLNCFGMSKPKNKTNIADLDEAWERIAELEKELGI